MVYFPLLDEGGHRQNTELRGAFEIIIDRVAHRENAGIGEHLRQARRTGFKTPGKIFGHRQRTVRQNDRLSQMALKGASNLIRPFEKMTEIFSHPSRAVKRRDGHDDRNGIDRFGALLNFLFNFINHGSILGGSKRRCQQADIVFLRKPERSLHQASDHRPSQTGLLAQLGSIGVGGILSNHRPVAEDDHPNCRIEMVLWIEIFDVINPNFSKFIRRHLAALNPGRISKYFSDRILRHAWL